MKKTTVSLGKFKSGFNESLQDVIKLMGENLVAWRNTPASATSERQQYLDNFLIAARDGFRLMATKLLRGRKRKDELDRLITSGELDESDAADDFAQSCVNSLIEIACNTDPKAPFIPATIDDLLAKAVDEERPSTGDGAPVSEYLHAVLFNSVATEIRKITKKAKESRVTSENLVPQIDFLNLTISDRRLGTDTAGVRSKVALQQNIEFARKIQDAYLDAATYKGLPLRDLLGNWTPLDEWIECCEIGDRPEPSVIEHDTLRNHINDIRFFICLAKCRTTSSIEMPNIPKTPNLWFEASD